MPEERFLTKAQAVQIEERAHELASDCTSRLETYGMLGAWQQALAEATVQPGDEGWCKGCRLWVAFRSEYIRDTSGVVTILNRMGCKHPDFKPGHCPKEEK